MRKLQELLPEILAAFCILACGLAGNALFSSLRELHAMSAEILFLRLAFVGLLLLLAGLLYRVRLRQYGAEPALWWGAFTAAVLAGASANSWQAWLEALYRPAKAHFPYGPLLYLGAFVLVLFLVRAAYRRTPPRSLLDIRTADPEGRAHLILFLSDISPNAFPGGVPQWLSGSPRSLKDDLERLATEKSSAVPGSRPVFWAWEQPLRGIQHHLERNTL